MSTIFFNTPGAELAAPGWQPVGIISTDGIPLTPEPPQPGTPYHTEKVKQVTYTLAFRQAKIQRRKLMNALGVYRLPGDKPLLHNGGKPR